MISEKIYENLDNYKEQLPNYATTKHSFELYKLRHSTEHVLMQAMQEIFGKENIVPAMGPPIESGFYFDFEIKGDLKISDNNFAKIEKIMHKIVQQNQQFIREEVSVATAKKIFADNPYKLEFINEYEQQEKILTIYKNVDSSGKVKFVDLCKGPHIHSTKEIGAHFKLTSVAGAYWRGDENRKMLTRIYGTAFNTKKELVAHIDKLERAELYNHRTLGKKLKLFSIIPEIGQGLPVWLPNGYAIRRVLEEYMLDLERKYGYVHVLTPHINNKKLFEKSGHLGFYDESMYSAIEVDDESYYLKPMNCPAGMMIYRQEPKSYRDLPLKLGEMGTVYRYEQSGELQGLQRVRGFTQNDAHIFTTPESLREQFMEVMKLFEIFYEDIGFKNYRYRLSLSDQENKDKYVGSRQDWERTENIMREVLTENKIEFYEAKGEAAFYGPKIDVQATNIFGKEDTISTLQIDFNLPERFELEYKDSAGENSRPYVLHRALIGSFERFFAFLIEHWGGKFPSWYAPRQITVLPVSDKFVDYAHRVKDELLTAGRDINLWLRVDVDDRSERLQGRIRDAELSYVPYILVVGGRDKDNNTVSVRVRESGDIGAIDRKKFIDKFIEEVQSKSLTSLFS